MKEITKMIELVDMYLGYLSPFYSKKIQYWTKQKRYAKTILDNGWDPSPNQLRIIKSNIDTLEELVLREINKK